MNNFRTMGFVILAICIVAMSAFPKAPGTGSFQSTEGPTTVFTAWRAALLVTAILMAAGSVTGIAFISASHVRPAEHSSLSHPMLC